MEKQRLLPLKTSAEENTEDRKNSEKQLSDTPWGDRVYGFFFIFLTVLGYGSATLFSQISGLKSNIFQLGTIRYLFMTIVACFITSWNKYSLRIEASHFRSIIVCAVFHAVYDTGYFWASSFMPVGVFEGLRGAIGVLVAITYDVYRKRVSKHCIVSAIIATLGILFLSQPWEKAMISLSKSDMVPCDAWSIRPNNITGLSKSIIFSNSTDIAETDLDTTASSHIHYEILSYFLLVLCAVLSIVRGFILKTVFSQYPAAPVIFWSAMLEGGFTFCMNIVYARLTSVPYFDLPSATYCFLFTFLFIICCAFGNICSIYSFYHAFVTMVAFGDVCQSVALYICQRTFLKPFYPGHANMLEILGVIVIIIGVLFPVVRHLFKKY